MIARPTITPHAAPGPPYSPLTFESLCQLARVAHARDGILDASLARPWHDPLWRAMLERHGKGLHARLPARLALHGRTSGATVTLLRSQPDPADQMVIDAAGLYSAEPLDDDGPMLRRLLLDARQASDLGETLVRLLRLGQYELLWGRCSRARDALSEAAVLGRERLEADRSEGVAHELAAVLDALGDAHAAADKRGDAAAAWAEAAAVTATLSASSTPRFAWGSAMSAVREAETSRRAGDLAGAKASVERALELAGRARTDPAEKVDAMAPLARRLADLQIGLGELGQAHKTLRVARGELEALLAIAPRRFDRRAQLAGLLRMMVELQLVESGLPGELSTRALSDHVMAIMSREPSRTDWQLTTAATLAVLADVRLAEPDVDRAAPLIAAEMRLLSAMSERDPERAAPRLEYARALRRLAYIAPQAEAADHLDEDERLLGDRYPTDKCLSAMARAWLAEESGTPALESWRRALALAEVSQAASDTLPTRALTLRCADALSRLAGPPLDP